MLLLRAAPPGPAPPPAMVDQSVPRMEEGLEEEVSTEACVRT